MSSIRIKVVIVPTLLILIFIPFSSMNNLYADNNDVQQEFYYDAKNKRDPFIPLVTSDGRLINLDKEESSEGIAIEGIIYDKNGRSFAIINNSVVGVGDSVGEYQVLKVEEEKVILIKDGQLIEVQIKKEEK